MAIGGVREDRRKRRRHRVTRRARTRRSEQGEAQANTAQAGGLRLGWAVKDVGCHGTAFLVVTCILQVYCDRSMITCILQVSCPWRPWRAGQMSTAKTFTRSACAIANSLDVVGDKWSLLVVRDLLHGKRTYGSWSIRQNAFRPTFLRNVSSALRVPDHCQHPISAASQAVRLHAHSKGSALATCCWRCALGQTAHTWYGDTEPGFSERRVCRVDGQLTPQARKTRG